MAGDSLGLFIWPEDDCGPCVYSAFVHEGHYILFSNSDECKVWEHKPSVDDNEFCISPLCMVKWND